MNVIFRTLLARPALVAYRCRWPRVSLWLDRSRREVIVEAGNFLTQEGLMPSGRSVAELARVWPRLSRALWARTTPETFYRSWDGEAGASNLAASAVGQFSRPYVAAGFFRHLRGFQGRILDYGCGTATLSMAWRRDFAPDAVLYLADVDNLARRFVQWRLDRSVDRHVDMVTLDLEGIPDCSLDVVFCLDVLEHLKNPSEVFFAVDRKLKNGGLLFLQAPWGGGFEHLDEAPVDWEKRGGAARLVSGYRLQSRLKPWGDLSGVFLKVGR